MTELKDPPDDAVVFPLDEAAPKRDLPRHPKRILVAEDEHLVCAELMDVLTECGFDVLGPARDGEQALRIAASTFPDLAVMDIRMPNLDGLQSAKQMYARHRIPVVLVSAYSDADCVESAEGMGVFGYVVKPARACQIRATIEYAWKRHVELSDRYDAAADLERRLEDRKVIEQAKWVLVARRNMTEPEAMKMLQKRSRDTRHPVADIARAILSAESLL